MNEDSGFPPLLLKPPVSIKTQPPVRGSLLSGKTALPALQGLVSGSPVSPALRGEVSPPAAPEGCWVLGREEKLPAHLRSQETLGKERKSLVCW